jgi:phage-related protein
MKPVLYAWAAWDSGEREGNGKGILADAVSCTVTEEINGVFELCMKYPITGIHGKEIVERDVIVAKPNQTQRAQPFRVYRMSRPIGGIFTVYARHISYDLDDIPVEPFKALTAKNAVIDIKQKSAINNPFTFSAPTEDPKNGVLELTEPATARTVLLGEENSIASAFFTPYKGQFYFDWYDVQIFDRRGADNGMRVVYGENMTKYNNDSNRTEFYNGIYPYARMKDGTLFTLPEKVLVLPGWSFEKIAIVDVTRTVDLKIEQGFEPTEEMLRTIASAYMVVNRFGEYVSSFDVSFVNLKDTAEYAHLEGLKSVALGDTVEIVYPAYGASTKEICSKTVFNVLTEKYDSVSIGKLRGGI